MLETKWLYLLLNLGTISVPLLRSFENKVAYYKSFPALFKSMAIVSGVFLVWDILFTDMGIWGFTPDYLSGIELLGLPLGEYLFFITVPFACVFIYRVLQYFFPGNLMTPKTASYFTDFLMVFSLAVGITSYEKWYTVTTFLGLGTTLFLLKRVAKVDWLHKFYPAYGIALLPFFLKNGILTGSFLETQVVWYNNAENLGIRLGTIPFEDVFYGMLLILGTVFFYEKFQRS
jgi:lycopene cyclase domain-containing protein